MNKLQYYLCKLAEEASEVAQIALKAQQFGLDECYIDKTNKERIHAELNDLLGVVTLLNEQFNFEFNVDDEAIIRKKLKVKEYITYSIRLGMVDEE